MAQDFQIERRALLALLGSGALALPLTARAQILSGLGIGTGLTSLLGKASDSALDKLAVPGAFYADPAIRIMLPLVGGAGGTIGKLLGGADKLGLSDGITRKLNDAAGLAAKEAKPVFRAAIDGLKLTDIPGIATQNDGATQYLRRTSGEVLKGKLRPLIDTALGQVGAFGAVDKLAKTSSLIRAAGITRDKLGNSVTDQALGGIFRYIGGEEGKLRADPLGKAGGLLKGVLGN
ncbi:DUF4197 domain-containing protein [Novosphingobium sp. MW5]|nr:DUF4197 domain-containing protein [Novosphingobium sp. MW5]